MNRNELMLVAAALVITGVLKMAEMPSRALQYFGHNPAVMAMVYPKLPMFADVPSAPEAPQAIEVASLPELPAVTTQVGTRISQREMALIHANVQRNLQKAACERQRSARIERSREIEARVHETVRRAVAQSVEALTDPTTQQ